MLTVGWEVIKWKGYEAIWLLGYIVTEVQSCKVAKTQSYKVKSHKLLNSVTQKLPTFETLNL
ncbi:hypothetical protein CJ739_2347 [Mariniflexile rhizosphaerae]|nr:hypothetical protein CJ739_2347 [Mariniflexile sp. TRM1-10]